MTRELKNIYYRKKEMEAFMKNFAGMPNRLLKYCEILLKGRNASPFSFQDTMSFRKLAISITSKCNRKCAWCYRFDPAYKDILNKELPFEKFKKIISNTKGKFHMIHLTGLGEPTLYPHLLPAIKLSRKKADKVKITSNASRLNKELIDNMEKSGLTDIEISIWMFDAKAEKKFRGVELNDSLQKVIYLANNTNLEVQVNIVVCSLNYKLLFLLVKSLRKAKKLTLHTIPLFETKQCREAGIKRVSTEKYKALLIKVKADIDKYNLNWQMSPTPEGSAMDPIIEMKKERNICFTCFEDPYISEAGELVACTRSTEQSSGVDATVGFEKAFNHPLLVKFRENMLKGKYPILCGQLCYLKNKNIKGHKKNT